MTKQTIVFKLEKEDVKKIDKLIENKEFDSRSSFVRRAVIDKLKTYETRFLS